MKVLKALTGAAFLFAAPIVAIAGEQTVTLNVNGMTCGSCSYQVQAVLKRVDGVKSASASLEKKEAVVTFDDARTNVAALTRAMTDAGFPSALKPVGLQPR